MAILRIKDKDGQVQEILAIRGKQGDGYVLTEDDKEEIAGLVSDDLSLSNYPTKEEVQSLIGEAVSNLPIYDGTYREIYNGEAEDV